MVTTAGELATALTTTPAGGTVVIKEGTYIGTFTSWMQGTATLPITVRAETGKRVIIDGALTINGQHTVWEGLEVMYSGWSSRVSAFGVPSPSDIPLSKSMNINADYTTIRRCIIHDLATVGSFAAAALWDSNIIYHIGWDAPDRGHGHALYMQNSGAECLVKRNVFSNCYGWGLHAYTQGGHIDDITATDNTCYNAGVPADSGANNILIGGYTVAQRPKLQRNCTYGASGGNNVGYDAGATDVVLTDNYAPDGITLVNCTFAEQSGNVSAPQSDNYIVVLPTDYGGIITIYNWSGYDHVTVNVSTVLAAGALCRLHNSQDYYGDVATGNVAGDGTISIDMRAASHSVAAIVAGTAEATVFPAFGCFVIEAG